MDGWTVGLELGTCTWEDKPARTLPTGQAGAATANGGGWSLAAINTLITR